MRASRELGFGSLLGSWLPCSNPATPPLDERSPLKILLLNGNRLANAFRQLGHRVATFRQEQCARFGHGALRQYSLRNALAHAGFTPDLIVVELFGPRWFLRGIERCDVPLAAVVYDSALNHFWLRDYLRLFDHVFVDFSESVEELARCGIHAHWAPYSIEAADFPARSLEKNCDIAFVGTTDQRPRRVALLDFLRAHFEVRAVGGHVPSQLVPGNRIVDEYAKARIVINETLVEGLNFRVFEALASGSLLLTEATPRDLPRLFRPGVHLATYTPRNLLERVRHYLNQSGERETIAAAGRRLVLERHTRVHRAAQLLDVIQHEWRAPRHSCQDSKSSMHDSQTSATRIESSSMPLARNVRLRRLEAARAQFFFSRRWPQLGAGHDRRTRRALELASHWNTSDVHVDSVWVRGVLRAEEGRWSEALHDLASVAERRPREILVCWQLALVEIETGNLGGARRALARGLERLPSAHAPGSARLCDALSSCSIGPDLFLALGELLALQRRPVERNAVLPRSSTLPWAPVEFLYRSIGEESARAPLRIAEWHADLGDPATALLVHEGLVARGLTTPRSSLHMGIQALACFRRELGLDLLGRALKEEPELASELQQIDLSANELRSIRPPRTETDGSDPHAYSE